MLVYIPNAKNPLLGTWCEVDRPPCYKPSAVHDIYFANFTSMLRAEPPRLHPMDDAAEITAHMLGIPLSTVQQICHQSRPKRYRSATAASACPKSIPNATTHRDTPCGATHASYPSANDSPPRMNAGVNGSQAALIHQ